MTLKDDGGDTISKNVLDWLTRVGAIATVLATILGLFVSEDNAKKIAFVVAGVLAIGSGAVYFYQRRRAAKLKIAESLEPLAPSAALRGLLPFEEGDQLPGRSRDVLDLYTLVASSSFRFGVLWGESGCGKTSLLRAGLIPKLRNEKFLPLYIGKPTKNPVEIIRSTLLREVQSLGKHSDKSLNQLLKLAAPKGKKIVIIFDQFEEFFLTNRTPHSRVNFIKWLGEAIQKENLPVAFLIGIRADFFAQLQNFAPQIPEPTSTQTTYQLQNFDTEQAKQIFNAAAKADGISFEPELIQAVIRELEVEEFIRPAELQVVGTRLKRKNILSLNRYEAHGGARGILSSYISDEIKQSSNEQAARLILRLMCADTADTKSPTGLSFDDILVGVTGTDSTTSANRPEQIQAILNQFITARVLIHTDEDKYNLVHDYLAPYVRTATEGTETNTERANRMLKRYIAEYKEDPKTRIPFGRIRSIQEYASTEVKGKSKAQELIKKSQRSFYTFAAAFAISLFFLLGLYFFYLTQAYYFSIDNSYIVLRAGSPRFTFLPGYGQVVVQTDFKRDDLEDNVEIRDEIDQGNVKGFWYEKASADYQIWGDQLATRLMPLPQSEMLRWLGQANRVKKHLIDSFTAPTPTNVQIDLGIKSSEADALALLIQTNPQILTPDLSHQVISIITDDSIGNYYSLKGTEGSAYVLGTLVGINSQLATPKTLKALTNTLTDPFTYRNNLSDIVSTIGQVAQANPQVVTPDILQALLNIATDPQRDSSDQEAAAKALTWLVQANPKVVTPNMFQQILDILINPQTDSFVASNILNALEPAAQYNSQNITPETLQTVIQSIIDRRTHYSNIPALSLTILAQTNSRVITDDMVQKLIDIIADPHENARFGTAEALEALVKANPQIVTPKMVQTLMSIPMNSEEDQSLWIRIANILSLLTQENPQIFTPITFRVLLETSTNTESLYSDRPELAYLVGQIANADPRLVTPDMLRNTMKIITDPQTDYESKSIALNLLGDFARANPQAVAPDMLQRVMDILMADRQSDSTIILESIAQANPQAIKPEMLQKLINILDDPQAYSQMSLFVVHTIELLSHNNPQAVTSEMFSRLITIVTDSQAVPDLRIDAARVLGTLTQANPKVADSAEVVPNLFDVLENNKDSVGRGVASYGLFEIALSDPSQDEKIRDALQELSNDYQPHKRIAAIRTLEMIALSDQAKDIQAHPDQIGHIWSRLNYLTGVIDSNYSPNEKYLRLAAFDILEEIAKIKNGNK